MEGGALAQVAGRLGVPWLEIRALSDLAGHDSRFDFAAFVDQVATSSAFILRRLLPVLADQLSRSRSPDAAVAGRRSAGWPVARDATGSSSIATSSERGTVALGFT